MHYNTLYTTRLFCRTRAALNPLTLEFERITIVLSAPPSKINHD